MLYVNHISIKLEKNKCPFITFSLFPSSLSLSLSLHKQQLCSTVIHKRKWDVSKTHSMWPQRVRKEDGCGYIPVKTPSQGREVPFHTLSISIYLFYTFLNSFEFWLFICEIFSLLWVLKIFKSHLLIHQHSSNLRILWLTSPIALMFICYNF